MQKMWGDKRYRSLNYFLREKYKEKVFKISLDGGFTCPNRDGKVAKGGCTFCSSHGSGDFAGSRKLSISNQFIDIKDMMNKKWKNGKYIAYFQAYTNTYGPIDDLRQKYEEAIKDEGVVALAIATRPDCLGEDVLDLLEEFSKKIHIWIELGFQTSRDDIARNFNRGYDREVFDKAVEGLRSRDIDVVVHTIFGLPEESHEDMLNTVKYVVNKDIQGIKLHLLHLMENTPMVKDYEEGRLKFLEQNEYVELIGKAICLIPDNIVIHRLTGDAPRESLIGPMWSLKKWEILNAIDKHLEDNDLYQGKYCENK
ncbi:TIGR01212 family radical SAM protein [Clostridium sp.]|uniref:TIGR01212 family radical SAM protein n=1 Tax=Clostridium sp. TaxID=1506 RepID=UPI003463A90E